jgi:hypothetical protein
MSRGHEFSFICDEKIAERIERVIAFADGIVKSKEKKENDMTFSVIKGD